ncbi:hypothetical protein ACN27F_24020 [Solwaraspora sp. WMMB335]|uniref:hypothetical protein n=1 Tax=Solwaraspora sp. WMMB335 TaxID=3404118 RepID=UPI003B950553
MTSTADLTHAVLIRVAEFLRTVPPEQLAALADGSSRLTIVGVGQAAAPSGQTRAAKARATRAEPAAPAVDVERVRADLATIDDRTAAGRYLDDLRLKAADLRALAKELGVAVPSRATKATIQQSIVQATVGRRLTSAVLSRPANAG